jgi:RND family efflux transporter MFP subunit
MRKKFLPLFLPVLFALGVAGCGHDAVRSPAVTATLDAPVVAVEYTEAPRIVEVQGTVHAADDAILSSRAMGPVVREYVKVGDHVAKGTALLEIEERMSAGQLAQAKGALAQTQAALALAERNQRRFLSLYEKQACSELELDMARMQYEQARGAAEQAAGAVAAAGSVADESIVRAPFDAVVVEKMASVGDLVAPGRPLVRVQSNEGREVWLTVRAGDVRHFRRGDTLGVTVDARPDLDALTAVVTEVAPAGDLGTQTFTVKAKLANGSVPAGVGATALARGEILPVLFVPRSAVYATGGMELVAVVDSGGIARTRAVTLGRSHARQAEVLSGLAAGDRVVDQRVGPIAEGTHIRGTRP